MDIINRDRNVFNSACYMVYLYNINSRLAVLIYGSWIIGYLEAKGLLDGLDPLDHFGG